MKISIIIPSNNEAQYVEELISFIKSNSKRDNIEEIIIVESFSTKHIIKVAEKNHAKLYYNLLSDKIMQMEMGAFQAAGEIIYFIKPGCTPPPGFDERIIKYVANKYAMGCFDYELAKSDNILIKIHKKLCRYFFLNIYQSKSFFIMSKSYYQTGGLKSHDSYRKLKKQILLLGNKSYL